MLTKKKLRKENEELKKDLSKYKIVYNYNDKKIEDDFNVLNQMLDLKITNYEQVIFVFNRYKEDKKVSVSTEEINKATTDIVYECFESLSKIYIDYLADKYFASKEAMVETYTQRVFLKLFAFGNTYNTSKTEAAYRKL